MDYWFETEHSTGCDIPNCGTAACIAGWAVALHKKLNPAKASQFSGPWDVALKVLRLNNCNDGGRLFHIDNWPEQFYDEYNNAMRAKDAKGMAVAASKRIDHFIATKGKE